MTEIDPIKLARLHRAFDRLPRFHANVVFAVRLDRMTYADIAERTGITPLHVERIFADALYRLDCDLFEQERGIALGPVGRFLRKRKRDLWLSVRLWRDRL
jgi:hypothetical protein